MYADIQIVDESCIKKCGFDSLWLFAAIENIENFIKNLTLTSIARYVAWELNSCSKSTTTIEYWLLRDTSGKSIKKKFSRKVSI